ncbi:DAK2 domain-containing protein [bacterium]|nr:DAK2 domain-containing protein [bacterium]
MTAESYFRALLARAQDRMQELNSLDAALGDGDHGTTLVRGLTGAVAAGPGLRAKRFMRTSGGASGTLFGLVLHEIEGHLDHGAGLGAGLERALTRICELGEVRPGDKTMVDALAPAVAVLTGGGSLRAAVTAAAAGRDATRLLPARRGRAQYVEGGGVGHLDPGAVSLVMLIETLDAQVPE